MDYHVHEYFRPYSTETGLGNFHRVIPLHDAPDIDCKAIKELMPSLCKGWFELALLPTQDRIDFLQEYWLSKMVHSPRFTGFLSRFFSFVDDIGVFITQKHFDDPFVCQIVYSLKDNSGFFHGYPPASEEDIVNLQRNFTNIIFPSDYLCFLQIHDGFCKTTDSTGILSSKMVIETYKHFQILLQNNESIVTENGQPVDPAMIIPFYESFGMPYYQCFWAEWYPEQEMGNVYFSSETNTLSDTNIAIPASETMAFPTFTDWLIFYMEQIDDFTTD